jgi:Fur family ferric uptake transcriptional regulator
MKHDDALRTHGLKATLPRMRVLDLLRREPGGHLSADEIHRRLLRDGADVGLATVYRVLGQLEQVGIVRRNVFAAGRAVFELEHGEHHDHLLCLTCAQVTEFMDPCIEVLQHEVARARGFVLVEHRLALFGVCRACRERGDGVP